MALKRAGAKLGHVPKFSFTLFWGCLLTGKPYLAVWEIAPNCMYRYVMYFSSSIVCYKTTRLFTVHHTLGTNPKKKFTSMLRVRVNKRSFFNSFLTLKNWKNMGFFSLSKGSEWIKLEKYACTIFQFIYSICHCQTEQKFPFWSQNASGERGFPGFLRNKMGVEKRRRWLVPFSLERVSWSSHCMEFRDKKNIHTASTFIPNCAILCYFVIWKAKELVDLGCKRIFFAHKMTGF